MKWPAALPATMKLVLTIIKREKEQRDINFIKIVAYSEVSIDCCLKIENRKQGGCSFYKEIYVETGALMLRGFLHHSVFVNVISFTLIYFNFRISHNLCRVFILNTFVIVVIRF